MKTIHKKISPKYFNLIKSGRKKFEWRLADFDIQENDILILDEVDPKTQQPTGRKLEKKVGYVAKFDLDDFGQKQELIERGFYIIQLE